ncbi:hypothetical protein B0H14DRAFT_2375543 [Mycena olivaceomarginata]|nr:hypothetical protein B0H14DRAFT_2375543 [Mycena olivaceomarginata]
MKSADQHLPRESQGGFFHRSSLPLPLFPLPFLPPAFLPQVRVCVNDALVAQAAGPEDRARIVDAICADGREILMHRSVRFSNDAIQRCLEAATGPEERRQIVACMRHNSKALDCEEEVCLLIVSELIWAAPATTLVNNHVSHIVVFILSNLYLSPSTPSFVLVLSFNPLSFPSAALACHETGSLELVTQHALEKTRGDRQDGIIDELLAHGAAVLGEVEKSQWGSYCIQHMLENGSEKHRQMALEHPLTALLEFATNEQVSKSVLKALKKGGKEMLDRVVQPARGYACLLCDDRRSLTGNQLIASVLPTAKKDRGAALSDCIRAHIVALRACKTGSKVI